MGRETISVTKKGNAAYVKLNRPDAYNALSTQLARDIIDVLEDLAGDDTVFAAVLTGEGEKAFCVGADLKERKTMTLEEMRKQRALFVDAFTAVARFPKPLVAAINGFALGGGFEFALCCDFIIAAENAEMGLPEVGLAIIPGGGGTVNLPRFIGKPRAKELIFTGRRISAAQAFAWGIVNKVVPRHELMAEAEQIMEEICKNGPIALRQAKRSIDYNMGMDIGSAFVFEAECYQMTLASEDRNEGLKAFNEKRKPIYKGR